MSKVFDPEKVLPEHWSHALTHTIVSGSQKDPSILYAIVAGGKKAFVKIGKSTDRYGLKSRHYEEIFDRLARTAKRWRSAH